MTLQMWMVGAWLFMLTVWVLDMKQWQRAHHDMIERHNKLLADLSAATRGAFERQARTNRITRGEK